MCYNSSPENPGNPGNPGMQDFSIPKSRDRKSGLGLENLTVTSTSY